MKRRDIVAQTTATSRSFDNQADLFQYYRLARLGSYHEDNGQDLIGGNGSSPVFFSLSLPFASYDIG